MVPGGRESSSMDLCEELVCSVLGVGLSPVLGTAALVFITVAASCHQQHLGQHHIHFKS